MKKLIIILFMFSFLASGQNPLIWGVDFSEKDKQDHLAVLYFEALVLNDISYMMLKDTKLKPFWAKTFSFIIGVGGGVLTGHLKEIYDKNHGGFYNNKDLKAGAIGAVGGSITLSLAFWNSIPKSKVPEGEVIYQNRIDVPEIYYRKMDRKSKRNQRKLKRNKQQ